MCKITDAEQNFCKEQGVEVGRMIRYDNRFWTIAQELKAYELWSIEEVARDVVWVVAITDLMNMPDFKVYGKQK